MSGQQLSTRRSAGRVDGQKKPFIPSAITRGDTLVEKLVGDISASVFPPGARLDEVTLATRYGVSRTPVREALRQLEATGLIERRPFRGAIVSQPSPEALADLFMAAGEIEATCARLAALAMTTAERNALRKSHKMVDAGRTSDDDGFCDTDDDFHERIYAGAHNSTMATFARDLRRRLSPFRRAQLQVGDRRALAHAEQAEIVRAIERGRDQEAADLMRMHMRQVEGVVQAQR